MPAVIVNEDRCQSSQVCVTACPYDAISMTINERGREVPFINDKCVDCLLCVPACPTQAILLVASYGIAVEPEVYNGIWVVVPDASTTSLGVVSRATTLAQPTHSWTGAVLLGPEQDEAALLSAGADVVVRHDPVNEKNTPSLIDALTRLVDERLPEALLFADGPRVRDLAAGLAGRLRVDLVTDVYDVENDLSGRRLRFRRPTTETAVGAAIVTATRPQLAVLSMAM